jgi:hypothetical protein
VPFIAAFPVFPSSQASDLRLQNPPAKQNPTVVVDSDQPFRSFGYCGYAAIGVHREKF